MYYCNVDPDTHEYNNIIHTSNYRRKWVSRSDMCFSVEVSSSVGSRQNYTLYTHAHYIYMYKYKRCFRFMVHHHHYNQRPFSSRPPQGFFSFIIITPFFPSFPHAYVCVCVCAYDSVCIPFQVCTASWVNTRRSLVIFGTLTQTQTHTRATWSTGQ